MFEMPVSPQPIGKVLDTGFRLFACSFKRIFVLVLIAALAISIPNFLFNNMAAADPEALARNFGVRMGLTFLVAYLVFIAFYNAVFYRMNALAHNNDSGAGAAAKVGVRKILPVLIAGILFLLAVTVGSILLIIPGLILMVSLLLYIPLIVCDDEGPVSSLTASHKLVWGNWWRTLAVFMVPFFVYLIAYIAVGLIVGVAVGVSAAGAGDGQMPDSFNTAINLATIVISLFAYPFFAAIMLAQLNDLKLRKRGGDLEAQLGG